MKERGILYQGAMVRAVLADTKTQTRRVCKPAEAAALSYVVEVPDPAERGQVYNGSTFGDEDGEVQFSCPYGGRGDRLWVRETWRVRGGREYEYQQARADVMYRATHQEDGFPLTWESYDWRPSIFMPRWASRILLEVTEVRVERLQDINRRDALAEGIVRLRDGGYGLPDGEHYHLSDPRQSYFSLWRAINGPGSVEANPWLWAVSFRRLHA